MLITASPAPAAAISPTALGLITIRVSADAHWLSLATVGRRLPERDLAVRLGRAAARIEPGIPIAAAEAASELG